ncbi:tetratricopeptide repeat protein [Nitratifractor sp.]
MNSFLPSYHDPIFSIILIIMTVIAVALVTHGWNLYRRERLQRSLYSFLERFDTASCSLEEENVPYEEGMAKPLLMLARAFEQSGNYDKTISILLYLIRYSRDDELLIYLGRVYLRAGFLQRAEEIFLEIIARHPRRTDVLTQLEYLYEKLGDFDKAREALEAMEAQGEKTTAIEAYLRFQEIRADQSLQPAARADAFEALLRERPELLRPILRELFRLDTARAWSLLDPRQGRALLDLLWYLPHAQLQLDIISSDPTLRALYYARGDLSEAPKEECGIFALDLLVASRRSGYARGDLHFSYLCTECKRSFPVSFVRCPACMALNSIEVEERLAPKQPQRSDTLF